MVTDSNQLLGQALGTCVLKSLLGRGGMGAVYLAHQSRPRRSVAVKVLMPGLLMETSIRAEFLLRFRREADAIAALDHVHIMPIYEYGEQEDLAYLVMPHVTGGTLREVLEKRGRLPLNEIVPIIEQAAAALDYAHAQGIIHRDLKPGNILFHADGRVVLADFGLAKILNETNEMQHESSNPGSAGSIIGTPEYFSPEQSTGNPVDQRTDVYSLGIVLYQMLTGRVPFTGSTAVAIAVKHTIEMPPSPSALNPTIPRSVEAVVMKAIAKKPENRYASSGELACALRAAVPEAALLPSYNTSLGTVHERMTPVSLMSNDTILDVPIVSTYDALTIHTPPTPSRTPVRKRSFITVPSEPLNNKNHDQRGGCQPLWMMLLGGFLALLLLVGGIATYLRVMSNGPTTSTASSSHAANTPTTTTPQGSDQGLRQRAIRALIPVGNILYSSPVPACGDQQSLWNPNVFARISCGDSATEMTDTSTNFLAGTFLDNLPNGYGIPNDYVLQIQVNESPSSRGGFGVFFRNQPGDIHQGTFSFLLFPQGRWEANVYNDTTGARTLLRTAEATVLLDGLVTIDIVIHANTYTFYLNGQKQGEAISSFYPSGTLGLAVNSGGDAFFRNLAIYTLK